VTSSYEHWLQSEAGNWVDARVRMENTPKAIKFVVRLTMPEDLQG
jgi:hypothetical protein